MKRILFLSCCIILAAHLCAGLVSADVIYNNGDPDLVTAYTSDFNQGAGLQAGDDFTLSSDAIIKDVHWAGVYGWGDGVAPEVDDFTIRIFVITGGTPNITPLYEAHVGNDVNRVPTSYSLTAPDPPGVLRSNLFEYSTDLQTWAELDAGDYLLSIVNNTEGDTDHWFWASSNGNAGNAHTRFGDNSPWLPWLNSEASFNLTGEPVPEPGTLLLLGTGLAGFAGYGIRLKRRKRA